MTKNTTTKGISCRSGVVLTPEQNSKTMADQDHSVQDQYEAYSYEIN